jgi:hypothetical protein
VAYQFGTAAGPSREQANDPGLRAFFGRVYMKVIGGLVLSAGIAWCVAYVPALRDLFFTTVPGEAVGLTLAGVILLVSPVLVLMLAALLVRDHTARGTGWLYWSVAALVGGSLSVLALVYTGAALVSTFLVTAGAFAGLSLWGYVTGRNLAALGNFLTMALFGLILAMVVNLFFRSPGASLVMDLLGVLIFAGLIASDTQRLKRVYYETSDPDALEASANYGALSLYLNFVNLFELLLSLSGSRSRR